MPAVGQPVHPIKSTPGTSPFYVKTKLSKCQGKVWEKILDKCLRKLARKMAGTKTGQKTWAGKHRPEKICQKKAAGKIFLRSVYKLNFVREMCIQSNVCTNLCFGKK